MNNCYYLIRHGESVYNAKKLHQGWKTKIPLSAKGKKQAKEILKKFEDVKLDFIYTSNLLRAKQTAQIINHFYQKKIFFSKRIIDYRRTKNFEGLHFTEYINDPAYLKWKKEAHSNEHFALQYGESLYQFKKRIKGFINHLEKKYKNKTILIVTHNAVIIEIIDLLVGKKIKSKNIKNLDIFKLAPSKKKLTSSKN